MDRQMALERLKVLDERLGVGQGATKEREKLNAILGLKPVGTVVVPEASAMTEYRRKLILEDRERRVAKQKRKQKHDQQRKVRA